MVASPELTGSFRETSAPSAARIRVCLLEEDEVFRAGLNWFVSSRSDMEVVGAAGTVHEAATLLEAVRPDVVVSETRLRDGSPLDLCAAYRARNPHVKVLFLAASSRIDQLVEAVRAGASGYLLKQGTAEDILDAISKVMAGETILSPRVTDELLSRLRSEQETERLDQLTPQERRILELIGEGMTNREIGDRLGIAERTVRNHVTQILHKLGLKRRTQAALFVAGRKGKEGKA